MATFAKPENALKRAEGRISKQYHMCFRCASACLFSFFLPGTALIFLGGFSTRRIRVLLVASGGHWRRMIVEGRIHFFRQTFS
jgi:hypothetical protein